MRRLFCLLACLFLLACGSETRKSESDTAADQTDHRVTTPDMVVELATRNVSCGCVLEEVGHCGNYIEIGSQYVEIANWEELGLGGMEWCGKSGVQAEAAGEIKDGAFVAATLVTKSATEVPYDE
ncbi:MAG: hypothetical protein OEO21_01495 [Candidatus Krumholzibacteria bacterium]|nr:hypothetical protein [Candidatus Krumholzibacteria bacterium]